MFRFSPNFWLLVFLFCFVMGFFVWLFVCLFGFGFWLVCFFFFNWNAWCKIFFTSWFVGHCSQIPPGILLGQRDWKFHAITSIQPLLIIPSDEIDKSPQRPSAQPSDTITSLLVVTDIHETKHSSLCYLSAAKTDPQKLLCQSGLGECSEQEKGSNTDYVNGSVLYLIFFPFSGKEDKLSNCF